jgi:hypothetical protein
MAEDSGAFKTNQANSRQIRPFSRDPPKGVATKPHRPGKRFSASARACRRRFLTSVGNPLRYSRISLIRCALAVSDASRTRPIQCHRVPRCSKAFAKHASEGGIRRFMLPGFRFLFAAIVLSMSILVFGLGAAALLRAAHEEFASNPSWRAAPETMFAQQSDATRPVLAMLRFEPATVEPKAPIPAPAAVAPVDATDIAVPAEPVPAAAAPAEADQVAAPKPAETPAPEIAKPDIAASESPAPSEGAPAQSDAPAAADTAQIAAPDAETKTASTEPVSPPAQVLSPVNETAAAAPAPATSEQASAPVSPEVDAAATKIATLGGPPVSIGTPTVTAAKAVVADKPDRSAIKKRQQARRAAHRRRLAARARQAQLAPQRPAAEPFTQSITQPPAAARR